MDTRKLFRLLLMPVAIGLLSACGGGMDDLHSWIDEVKARPGGRIEPLPQIQPYETYTYQAQDLRSPFVPDRQLARAPTSGPRPDRDRPREYLEQYPLDTLKMAGTVTLQGRTYGLLQTRDGLLHRVQPGQYVGQNDGRIVDVSEGEIAVEELIADGMGGFFRRPAAIALSD